MSMNLVHMELILGEKEETDTKQRFIKVSIYIKQTNKKENKQTNKKVSIYIGGASEVAYQVVKNPPVNVGNAGDEGSIPGSARSPEEGNGNPLQNSCLENSMDRRAWQATVHGVTKSKSN